MKMVNNYYEGIGINNEWGLWTLYSLQKWAKLVYHCKTNFFLNLINKFINRIIN